MASKLICCLIGFAYLIAIGTATPVKDLILGRTYVVPAETQAETSSLLRLDSSATTVQQILYAVFTPIQGLIDLVLSLICTVIPSVTALVETFRTAILVNLTAILDIIIPIVAILAPQIGAVLQVVQILLNAGNQLLYNGTTIISEYGCSTILSVNDIVSSIVDVIIGVF